MPDEHSQFRRIKKSIVGICSAVVMCFVCTASAMTCCRYSEDVPEAATHLFSRLHIGMSDAEVVDETGNPDHIDSSVTLRHKMETWIYDSDNMLSFEDGRLIGIHQFDVKRH